ncbi:transcriptional regulator [Cypionkella aquatica]|uniref:Transcriptional regulator n=1 Tax=Cypionkella aquatica TaxID=1756042 RepID=A0AA37U365_9RHOB|nr:Rrf2 family transcriptional regulator [Cypionkella aquatica]GLS86634.1 transcriptional regulator [Cypionkella aquatica]
MKHNGKLALALHSLGHLALSQTPMTSEAIAAQNQTHPVVVRRVLGRLRAAGLLQSEKGHAGGWRLARPAAQISVADVYAAIDEPFLSLQLPKAPPECGIVAAMQTLVSAAMTEAEAVLHSHFARQSIADLAQAMQGHGHAAPEKPAFLPGDSPL